MAQGTARDREKKEFKTQNFTAILVQVANYLYHMKEHKK
jgi:hypothetical protein